MTDREFSNRATAGADQEDLAQQQTSDQELSEGMRARAVEQREYRRRIIGLIAGVLGAVLIFWIMPTDLDVWPRLTAATAVLMAVWWMTEAIPIPATALLPLIIFPLAVPAAESDGGVTVSAVGANYGNDVIFLFMGGFCWPWVCNGGIYTDVSRSWCCDGWVPTPRH